MKEDFVACEEDGGDFLKKLTSFFIILIMILNSLCIFAENPSAYEELCQNSPELLERFRQAELPEDILKSFIDLVEEEADSLQMPETREVMEEYFISILIYVITRDDYIPVQITLDAGFPEEVAYMAETMRVPPVFEAFFMFLMADKILPWPEASPTPHGGYYYPPEETMSPKETQPTPIETPVETPIFSDLDDHEWAKFYIKELYDKSILNGYEDGTFRPANEITRAEVIKLLATLLLDNSYKSPTSEYSDINGQEWFYNYLLTSEYFCIIKDIYKNEFHPDEKVTRQELAAIAYRAILRSNIKLPVLSLPVEFVDFYEFANFAHDPIRELQKAGVLNGVGDNKFSPLTTTTRAEVAKIIYIISTFKQ